MRMCWGSVKSNSEVPHAQLYGVAGIAIYQDRSRAPLSSADNFTFCLSDASRQLTLDSYSSREDLLTSL